MYLSQSTPGGGITNLLYRVRVEDQVALPPSVARRDAIVRIYGRNTEVRVYVCTYMNVVMIMMTMTEPGHARTHTRLTPFSHLPKIHCR